MDNNIFSNIGNQEKVPHQKGGRGLQQAPQGSGHGLKPDSSRSIWTTLSGTGWNVGVSYAGQGARLPSEPVPTQKIL